MTTTTTITTTHTTNYYYYDDYCDDDDDADDGKKRFEQMAKRERFIYKVEGTDKVICKFFQWGSCKFAEVVCRIAHLRLRCHHPGHGCLDAACKARPKLK